MHLLSRCRLSLFWPSAQIHERFLDSKPRSIMRFSGLLFTASFAMSSKGETSGPRGPEVPNPDYPGTRDILYHPPNAPEPKPKYIAVPNEYTLEQIKHVDLAGMIVKFDNGQDWKTIGGKRVLRHAQTIADEAAAYDREHGRLERVPLSQYPMMSSPRELDEILATMPSFDEMYKDFHARQQAAQQKRETDSLLSRGSAGCRTELCWFEGDCHYTSNSYGTCDSCVNHGCSWYPLTPNSICHKCPPSW